jgi:hypothetical protein
MTLRQHPQQDPPTSKNLSRDGQWYFPALGFFVGTMIWLLHHSEAPARTHEHPALFWAYAPSLAIALGLGIAAGVAIALISASIKRRRVHRMLSSDHSHTD